MSSPDSARRDGLGEGVARVAGLGGCDQLCLGRLALPIGELLWAGVDQQGDRVGPSAAPERSAAISRSSVVQASRLSP